MKYYFVVFILLPIIFLVLALLAVRLIPFLVRFLNVTNPVNILFNKNNNIYDAKWLSNKFEMIFWISLIILMVGLTIAYSW